MEKQLKRDAFLQYHFLSDVNNSPNGKWTAYISAVANVEKNGYDRNLHVYHHGKTTHVTNDGTIGDFIWDDKDTLLFSALRDSADKKRLEVGEELTSYYRISMKGGEAIKAFTIPLAVQKIEKVKKGIYLIMVHYDLTFSKLYTCKDKAKNQLLKQKKDAQDYEVIDELPYYFNGMGYMNKKRMSLFLYQENTGSLKRISDEMMNVSNYAWNKDKSTLYFSGVSYDVVMPEQEGIYAYHMADATVQEILVSGQYAIGDLKVWNDQVFFVGSNQKQYGMNENPYFYTIDEHQAITCLAKSDDSIGSSVGSDCRLGGGRASKIVDNQYVYIMTKNERSCLCAMDDQGNKKLILDYPGSVDSFDLEGNRLSWIGMMDGKLQELYGMNLHNQVIEQHTHENAKSLQGMYTAKPQPLTFHREGYDLQGWVLLPKGFDEKKQYPAILDIHGGPKTVYGEVFYHEMQVWANEGYLVFFMNPRGSDGKGNDFADIRGQYGTGDYDDLMYFTDLVLETFPQIDAKRIGVTGGSYGGFMTNWIIGHTTRFAAAASQRSIANWLSFDHTSDIGPSFGADQQQASTWKNMEKLWFHSPLKYADQAKTPTLFIHSNEDYRCPFSEGQQMVSALMEHGIETRLVMFKGENHELSRSGKPLHRMRRLNEITDWMNKFLK